ncbi:MAG: protein-glutamate O-methyltransferase CheR [Lachnospiraceae bacterium]|nr:protein-glutamate O-methyltransferase CheR [Lachnospiraceae bacterium]
MYEYSDFIKDIYKLTGIDLACYKERQMKRRLETLVKRHKLPGFREFVDAIQKDKVLYEDFLSYLTINVSEFYRNPNQWKILDTEMVPRLLKEANGRPLKIWSAACSTGDEPYSLVMLLSRHVPLHQISIVATDIDKQILEKAKVGIYDRKSLQNLPEEFKQKYFNQLGEKSFQIREEIKKQVQFRQHNLLRDNYDRNYDLIVCRNVMIYFTEEAKDGIYQKFYQSLRPQGVLFVGSTEQMIHAEKIGFTSEHSFFYVKS